MHKVQFHSSLNKSGATWAVALDISNAFERVCHAGLLGKLKSYGISGQIFGLISSFLSNRWLWVGLDGKSLQEYPVNAEVLQGSIFCIHFFIHQWPCNFVIYVDDATLYSKCDKASDLWLLNLNFVYKTLCTGAGSRLLVSIK